MRPYLLLPLLAVIGLAVFKFTRPDRSQLLAFTECPYGGLPRVTVSDNVAPEDSMPVRMHEAVHAAQCAELGPTRYRLRNLTAEGRLSLEAPAYCAGARARLSQRMDSALVRERLKDDIKAAFRDRADSLVMDALRSACPELAR